MDHEVELVRQQMEETRLSLADKLECLEQKVVNTVEGTTLAVADTVETVRAAVQDTVQSVKGSLEDTVDSVKEKFDLAEHVRQHPWLVMGASVAAGFAGGYVLHRASQPQHAPIGFAASSLSAVQHNGGVKAFAPQPAPIETRPGTAEPSRAGGLIGSVSDTFGTEIAKLKGLAIGALLGVVRDLITRSVSNTTMASDLAEVVDGITVKLGGEPIRGSLFSTCSSDPKGESHEKRHAPEMGRSVGSTYW